MSDDGEVEPEALEEDAEEASPSEEMAEAPMSAGTTYGRFAISRFERL